jgi:hypothetical protein
VKLIVVYIESRHNSQPSQTRWMTLSRKIKEELNDICGFYGAAPCTEWRKLCYVASVPRNQVKQSVRRIKTLCRGVRLTPTILVGNEKKVNHNEVKE